MYGEYRGRSVIEGADWSPLVGGRQDYMTYYQRCREVTIEMSYQSEITDTLVLPTFWDKSKDALLSYAVECSYGFWGTVTDATTGEPVEAMIKVLNHDRFNSKVLSHLPLGDYHRPIMAGTYTVEVSAPCYKTETFTVTTRPGVGIRHDVLMHRQTSAPEVYDQYILPGMQTTLVALSQNEVLWYDSDTASRAIATGNSFTTPTLYDTTTYYLEECYQDDSLLCVSPRSAVTVYVIDTTSLNSILEIQNSELKIHPNPAEDYLTVEGDNDGPLHVEIYDTKGTTVLESTITCPAKLDITKMRPGCYFMKATCGAGRHSVVKFIKGR